MKQIPTLDPMHRGLTAPSVQARSCTKVTVAGLPPCCGARTRGGSPCRNLPMRNGRCGMHGGASTGPRTVAGLERMRTAKMIHGGRSRETIEFRRLMRELRADARRIGEMT